MIQTKVYYGESRCAAIKKDGTQCKNLSYYEMSNQYLCGVHSKKDLRNTLPKNPNKKQIATQSLADHSKSIEDLAANNRSNGIKAHVICHKMAMMKNPGYFSGYLNVFPNYMHGNRKDGLGLPSLSPKSIGPIDHKQPGLPIAQNLENFHQGNKVFPSETDATGEPLKSFFDTQIEMYNDTTPHRHKATATATTAANKNIPCYSIWVTPDGVKHKIDYYTSRQFYCTFYERAVLKDPAFVDLTQKLLDGYCLRICGYDAYPIPAHIVNTMDDCYKDITKPFGHELVLYTMLVLTPDKWPWRKFKTFDF